MRKSNIHQKYRRRKPYLNKNLEKKQDSHGDSYEEKYIRLLADFENYKQRVNGEKNQLVKYANENLLVSFLPSLSLLANAVDSQTSDPQLSAYLAGFKMISDQIFNSLEMQGVSKINDQNKKFDPNLHEAIQVEVNENIEDDIIIKTISSGYKLNDKVIMHAKVKINKQQEPEEKEKNE